MDSRSLGPLVLLPSQRCSSRVTGSSSRPRPQKAQGAGSSDDWLSSAPPDSLTAPRAHGWLRMSFRDRSPQPPEEAGCAATALLTWRPPLRRLTYAARREAERTSGSEQVRRAAGSPQPLSQSLPPSGGCREPPATPPHPDSYPLHAYLKERERGKERYLSPSERDTEAPTILRSNGAGKRWQQQQPKNSLSRELAPTHLGSPFGTRQDPPPPRCAHYTPVLSGCGGSLIQEPAGGGRSGSSYSLQVRVPFPPKNLFRNP